MIWNHIHDQFNSEGSFYIYADEINDNEIRRGFIPIQKTFDKHQEEKKTYPDAK